MFKALLIKEIHESLLNMRFMFTFVLCIVLIPLSFYLGYENYKTKMNHIVELENKYLEQYSGNVSPNINAEGYRKPSPYSIFCLGLENHLPDKAIISNDGNPKFDKAFGLNNPLALLTGKIDFIYVVCFILSLLVLALTCNSINGEKENGTLKLITANPVPRWSVIVAKITGPFTLISISFITGILAGTVLLLTKSKYINFSFDFMMVILVLTGTSLLFLFIIFNAGILISILSKNSFSSMVISLFVYVILAMLIPKVSPMLAQAIYPVESVQVHNKKKDMLLSQLIREKESDKKEFMKQLKMGADLPLSLGELDKYPKKRKYYDDVIKKKYDQGAGTIDAEYDEKIASALLKLEKAYNIKADKQKKIAFNLSRISPVISYINLTSDLASTGLSEVNNYRQQAYLFGEGVQTSIYDKVIIKKYYDAYGYEHSRDLKYDPENIEVPAIRNYHYANIAVVFHQNWVDFILLCFFSIALFTLSVFMFIRYDVR